MPVREMGDCERSERPDEILPDVRRCWARAKEPSASGCAAGRPFVSPACDGVSGARVSDTVSSYLLARARPASLHTVAALDDICLERDWSWSPVQLQEQAAGVAENRARFIAAPERSGTCSAVLAHRLDACQRGS